MANVNNDEFLLQCVANYKPLYDKNDKGYKSIIQRESCWSSVAELLNTTVPAAKACFKALREKYKREVVIEEKYGRSGTAASTRPVRPLMSLFKCLYGQEVCRSTTSNFEILETTPSEYSVENDMSQEFNNHSYSQVESELVLDNNCEPQSSVAEDTPTLKRGRLSDSKSLIDHVLVDVSNAVKSINQKTSTKYDLFAQYVAAKLNYMDADNAAVLMKNINLQFIEFKRNLRN